MNKKHNNNIQNDESKARQYFKMENKNPNIIENLFYLLVQKKLFCQKCNLNMYYYEYNSILLLEIDKNQNNIKIIDKLFGIKNKSEKCPKCNNDCKTEKKFEEFPQILIAVINSKNDEKFILKDNFKIIHNGKFLYSLNCLIEKNTNDFYYLDNSNWYKIDIKTNDKSECNTIIHDINPSVLFYLGKFSETKYQNINNNNKMNNSMMPNLNQNNNMMMQMNFNFNNNAFNNNLSMNNINNKMIFNNASNMNSTNNINMINNINNMNMNNQLIDNNGVNLNNMSNTNNQINMNNNQNNMNFQMNMLNINNFNNQMNMNSMNNMNNQVNFNNMNNQMSFNNQNNQMNFNNMNNQMNFNNQNNQMNFNNMNNQMGFNNINNQMIFNNQNNLNNQINFNNNNFQNNMQINNTMNNIINNNNQNQQVPEGNIIFVTFTFIRNKKQIFIDVNENETFGNAIKLLAEKYTWFNTNENNIYFFGDKQITNPKMTLKSLGIEDSSDITIQ